MDVFGQIEAATEQYHKDNYRTGPVPMLPLEPAPHPDSEDGKELLERIFRYYREVGFPHVSFADDQLHEDFLTLQAQEIPVEDRQLRSNMVGLRIVNMFHPAMEAVKCRSYRTAQDVFADDGLFRGAIRKLLLYSKEPGRTVGNRIRIHLLSYSGVQGVSNFRPGTAKQIYDHFQPKRILDFSMGWGGRLLAALAGRYPYVGIDPNGTTCQGNLQIQRKITTLFPDLHPKVRLVQGCAEDLLGRGYFPEIDLIFSSPPYVNAEQYENSPYQSFKRYPSKTRWYEEFLKPCVAGSFVDLEEGGHFVINVNPNMGERTLQYAEEAGFTLVDTWMYLLSLRQQNKRHSPTDPVRGEPVYVFRKGAERPPDSGSILGLFGE